MEPLEQELQELVQGIAAQRPGITLAVCLTSFKGVFDPGEVRKAVNNLAKSGRLRLEATLDQLGTGIVANVKLWPTGN